ncbi:phosphonate transport system substrate-binding protein [Anaerosolibacter carboniphilus]|uniref:Phosphonate transport system substrate-binding protein n=1 Tax=Anaerosolibacter carboniphilus TaxID=1417629 RepID=A0A841KWA8_9FIRM|nr:putative selenate ABC transporter substrate-binding protein [Anaerosolibacter carboniphilus]MBB6216300.1 phosphonate transport system substrate-binding protein [Anaerosolibacter carboniphilus]
MKKIITILLALLMVASLTACSQKAPENTQITTQDEKPVFKIGAIPDQDASELQKNMEGVAKYLSEKTGLQVEFVPSVDYAALVTAFEREEMQLVWFGGLTGVQARNVVPGAEAIAQRPRDAEFQSVFITQKDLDVTKLEDLKGKTFTFGSESSTSGHLMPRYFLMETGIDPVKDFNGQPNFSGSHDKTIKLVESGAFETGALNISVWEKSVNEGKVDLNKVKVFYTTPAYYDYNWTINNVDETFGEGTKAKIKEALLSMGSGQEEVLTFFQTDKFIETKNENYGAIETVAKQLGIIK